jgi:hypothetical protein
VAAVNLLKERGIENNQILVVNNLDILHVYVAIKSTQSN